MDYENMRWNLSDYFKKFALSVEQNTRVDIDYRA
jgi:hypothetical protein